MAGLYGHAEIIRELVGHPGSWTVKLDARNNDGGTPLHNAALGGRNAASRALLEFGADASLRNKAGKTALQLAEKQGNAWIAQLLRNEAARRECAKPVARCAAVAASSARGDN